MVNFLEVIKSFFIMLKKDIYVLIRIEFLVALVTVMFFVVLILDIYRCRSRSSFLRTVLKTVDSLSDHLVPYLLGAMQSARFWNEMFPVWAIVLVSLRVNLGYLSGYNISNHDRRLAEVGHVIKYLGVGLLNGTRPLEFSRPLWSLWAILQLRSIYRCYSHNMAITSLWHGRSSEFLPQYLSDGSCHSEQGKGSASTVQHNLPCNGAQNNPSYPVYGESKQKINLKKPGYNLHLEVVDPGSFITLKKIMECRENLLSSDTNHTNTYKDMGQAFTLSRLLRCRLEDVPLKKKNIGSTRDLIKSIISYKQQTASAGSAAEKMAAVPEEVDATAQAKSAFKILELELAFVRDYFYTLYPVVFWKGLSSLCFSLLLSMVTFALTLWLAIGIRKAYQSSDHFQSKDHFVVVWLGGFNVDVVLTWVFLSFMMFKEVWEILTYLLSNWTRLLLVCKYVQSGLWFMKFTVTENLISSFFVSNIADPWHGRIDQYDFLSSISYKPSFWKLVNRMSLGKTPEKYDGRKSGNDIKIPDCVKPAILEALRHIGLDIPHLPIPSLVTEQSYKWALLDLGTCSEVILVWHIATSLCEIKLAQEHGMDLKKPGFLRSAWSGLKTFASCTSKPYLVNKNMTGQLKTDYHTAISLSRYCAYLLVFRSELLPDSFVIPDLIFDETLEDAREKLDGCNLILDMYNKLIVIEQETEENNQEAPENNREAMENNQKAAENNASMRLRMKVVQQGATLGKDLISMDKKIRWKILSGVWADLLVHIAPSWNAVDHKKNLESGGEFITLIWALLSHCGIEKSRMWDKDQVSKCNSQVPHEDNTEPSSGQPVEKQQVSESNSQVPREDNTETSSCQPVEKQQAPESSAQIPRENNTKPSDIQHVEEQQVSESSAQVPRENNTKTSDIQPLEEQQVSKSSAQVPKENNAEISEIQPVEEQQASESSAQVPPENNTDISEIQPVEEQPDGDGIESDQESKASSFYMKGTQK